MPKNEMDARKKCEKLKATRNILFRHFLKNPLDTRLALKIKTIDDQIAECTEQMKQRREERD